MGEQISQPKVTLNILGASVPVANVDQRVLIVHAKTAIGTAVDGALNENVGVSDINGLFGLTSILAQVCRSFKSINDQSQMDVIALDDNGAGVAATGSFNIAGPATESGTLSFIVGSKQNNKYDVGVTDGMSAAQINAAFDVLVAADTDAPFSTADIGDNIKITAENDGTYGNDIGLKIEGSVAGVTTSVTRMNSGLNDPSLATLFDPIASERYQTIVYPGSWDIATAKTLMGARLNVDNKILDGLVVICQEGLSAGLVVEYEGENVPQFVIIGNKTVALTDFKGGSLLELNDVIAAQLAAIRSLRLTPDVSISNYTVAGTNGARDSFGGDAIRSLPYFNTPFALLPLIPVGTGFTDAEISDLNDAGVSVLGNNTARNSIIAGEMFTLYKTDAAGNPDPSFEFVNFLDTMSGIREYYFNNLKSRFAQSRLTTGEILPRRNMANQQVIEGFCAKLYSDLAGEDFVLTQDGEAALNFYKQNLSVALDLANRKVTMSMKTPIVTQLGNIIGSIQLSFTAS